MNNKIKKILLTLPFFALHSEEKKDDKKKLSPSKLALSGGVYGAYNYNLGMFSLGPIAGVEYSFTNKINAFIGASVRFNLDLGYISGVRVIAAALVGQKDECDTGDKSLDGELNKSVIGFFKGGFAIAAVDTPYYFSLGLLVKYSETSIFTKALSIGLVIMPNVAVIDSVEVGAILFAGYHQPAKADDIKDDKVKKFMYQAYLFHNFEKIDSLSDDCKKVMKEEKEANKNKKIQNFDLVAFDDAKFKKPDEKSTDNKSGAGDNGAAKASSNGDGSNGSSAS